MGSNETRNLWLSIGAGVFAAFLLYSWSQEKRTEYSKKYGSMRTVVVAKEDINEMRTIYDTMLTTIERPSEFVDPDVVSNPDEIVGNVAGVPIKKGQSIMKTALLTPGPDTGISLQIAPSKRAIAIPCDEVRCAAKLIRPGDRIDILAAVDTGKGVNQKREVQTLMQDVVVLATGVNIMNNIPRVFEMDSGGKSVTQMTLTGDTKYSTISI
jgi:pilus assembly protein CpaB